MRPMDGCQRAITSQLSFQRTSVSDAMSDGTLLKYPADVLYEP